MGQSKAGLAVFYDGSCRVCSREIEQYRKRDKNDQLTLVDIAAPDFDPAVYGLTQRDFMAKLHVRDASGTFHTGVDAFVRIWEAMPQPELHLLAAVVALPGINLLARGGYALFARFRGHLPKLDRGCTDDSCDPGQRRS